MECVGVASWGSCKEVRIYRFHPIYVLIPTYPNSTCISSFLQHHPNFFVHFVKVFILVTLTTSLL